MTGSAPAFGLFGRSGLSPSAAAGMAARAEALGYGAVLVTETYSDVFPYAIACARATRTVQISTAIANMEVVFDGKGIVSDANKPGFLYRLLQWITPF